MTPDPTLAALSDTLFSVAVGLYSLALVAFCAQLAFGRRPARQLVAAGGPSLPQADGPTPGADVAAEPEPAATPHKLGAVLEIGEKAPLDAVVWTTPRERARIGELLHERPLLLLFYLFDWSTT